MEEQISEGKKQFSILKIFLGTVLVLVLANTVLLGRLIFIFGDKIDEAEERARPAELEIITISDAACSECFNVNTVLDQIKKGNVLIENETNIDIGSPEAAVYIEQYGIERVPAFIVKGEINKDESMAGTWEKMGKIKEDAFVFTNVSPPYHDVSSGEITGMVEITFLGDETCAECFGPNVILSVLGNFGLPIAEYKTIYVSSQEGAELRGEYGIEKVPTVLISGDTEAYPTLKAVWDRLGTIEKDGTYVFRSPELLKGAQFKEL